MIDKRQRKLAERLEKLSPERRRLLERYVDKVPELSNLLPIMRRPGQSAPLSFAQQRLWFLEQLLPGTALYNIPLAVEAVGKLNRETLQRSINEVIRRHAVLRTRFEDTENGPIQVVTPAADVHIDEVDLTRREDSARQVGDFIAEEAKRPFDLQKPPLLRFKLFRLQADRAIVTMVVHHIVSDLVSMNVLMREIGLLYQAYSSGSRVVLDDLPIQYKDFAMWQRESLQGKRLDAHITYWRHQLEGLTPLELPTDRRRPLVGNFRGALHGFELPRPTVEALQALGRNSQATLFMVLLAAFSVVLYRYSGQDDIAIGSPIANRTRAEIEGLIGLFINTLVLRTRLSGNPAFTELLGQVRETCLQAYTHQELPFEKLVEELRPGRDLNRNPLFQVALIHQNTSLGQSRLPGLTFRPLVVESGTAKFDFSLYMTETEAGMSCQLEYNSDLFESDTIERISGHFKNLLEAVGRDPSRPISSIRLLDHSDREKLLVSWNLTDATFAAESCIHELFEKQVTVSPDAIALVHGAEHVTYRELELRSNRLADHLVELGVGPEVLVGVCMKRSVDMIVGLLAILKAGGAYVPLDPTYPSQRLSFMVANSQARVVVADEELLDSPLASGTTMVCPRRDIQHGTGDSKRRQHNRSRPENLAYVIYTSGSTGVPKGVQISHRALVNLVCSVIREPGIDRSDTVLASTSISFDIAALEIFPALAVGARIVIPDAEQVRNPGELLKLIRASGITLIQATPTAWQMLLDSAEKVPRVKILCGGEALSAELATRLVKIGSSAWNLYGPTETTVWSSAVALSAGAPITIGRPLSNNRIYILDQEMEPVPIGVAGEIYIGGEGVARGYLRRPELTAERFVPDPFGQQPGGRLFRTGDLARYRANSEIEFLGRFDDQVKVRGFRIEPGEIEAVLSQHPDITHAVVVMRGADANDKRLVAFVVPRSAQAVRSHDLVAFAKDRLPPYMVPSEFVTIDRIPLTPNGKIDRKTLAVRDSTATQSTHKLLPRNALELQLTHVWKDILGADSVGIRDNFFDIGGHSLLALRLVSQLRRTLGRELPLSMIFEAPTIEELAAAIRSETPQHHSPLVCIQSKGAGTAFFCVHPAGGQALCYSRLARQIGNERPFFALQADLYAGRANLPVTIEALAAEYVDAVVKKQPHGPFLLGGWSFGGKVAFEMAQQLNARGLQVAYLGIFDTEARELHPAEGGVDDGELIAELATLYLGVDGASAALLAQQFAQLGDNDRVQKLVELAMQGGVLEQESDADQIRNLLSLFRSHAHAAASYVPQRYPGAVTLFRTGLKRLHDTHALGWEKVAEGGVEVRIVRGTHISMMLNDAHLRQLVEYLRADLRTADAVEDASHPAR